MDNAKVNLVRNWLIKALHDLESAKTLSNSTPPYLDTAIYHCQQAVEKAMKGFLVYHDSPFEKTHDIEILIQMAIPSGGQECHFLPWRPKKISTLRHFRPPTAFSAVYVIL